MHIFMGGRVVSKIYLNLARPIIYDFECNDSKIYVNLPNKQIGFFQICQLQAMRDGTRA